MFKGVVLKIFGIFCYQLNTREKALFYIQEKETMMITWSLVRSKSLFHWEYQHVYLLLARTISSHENSVRTILGCDTIFLSYLSLHVQFQGILRFPQCSYAGFTTTDIGFTT